VSYPSYLLYTQLLGHTATSRNVEFDKYKERSRTMSDLKILTTAGKVTVLEEEAVEKFKSSLRGELLRPGDDGYDEARTIWNAMIDRRPALIVRCAGTADVIAAVNLARKHSLLTAVRGGGHNVAGFSMCDQGLVLDLSKMKSIRVDPHASTVRAEPGVTLGELDRETQSFGLVVPAGIVTSTGISGLTLGGGLGWLSRAWGLTCDNLISADVVTADGRLLYASKDENKDLFWAIRGGGGNFGIVTSFEYRCRQFGPIALAGIVLHPIDRAKELLAFYREYTASAPDEVTALALIRLAPSLPFVPEDFHGAPVAGIVACYAGPPEAGIEVIRPIKEWGEPIVDAFVPKPFVVHQSMFDAGQPPGGYYYWKSHYFDELVDEALDAIVEHGAAITSPMSILAIVHLAGAVARVGDHDTAYPNRKSPYVMNVNGSWADTTTTEANVAWARETWDALAPYATGARFVNFEAEQGVMAIYGEEKYKRLVEIKNKYDPQNLFRLNQNIKSSV
jgi:FAD/FMN-containing dehydrogenase